MSTPLTASDLPQTPAEWSAVIVAAHALQVSPLLYYRLHAAGLIETLLPEVRDTLRNPVWRLTALNEQRTHELAQFAARMHEAGVPLIPLKGACLDLWVYPRPGLRPMSDLDVLVPGNQTAIAARVMMEAGYACSGPLVDDEHVLSEMHHLPAFIHPVRHTHVEVHGTLASAERPFVDADILWQHALSASISGVPVKRLCTEHLLMHVCWHGVLLHRLQGSGLRILLDVAMILEHCAAELDWDLLLEHTVNRPWQRAVALGIWGAQAHFGASVPDEAARALGMADLPAQVKDAVSRSLLHVDSDQCPPNGAACMAAVFTQPWGKRWEYLNRSLWRSKAFLASAYGVHPDSPWFWLCYPRRLADAARLYGFRLLKALCGNRDEIRAAMPALTIERWCRDGDQ